jgi:hypothetical protein
MLRVGLLSRLPLQRYDDGRHCCRGGSAGRSADFGGRLGARTGNFGVARHGAGPTFHGDGLAMATTTAIARQDEMAAFREKALRAD